MTEPSPLPPAAASLLATIDDPAALRRLPATALPALAAELRAELIASVASSGGHFAASLGVVELTIALHRVFDTPDDALIWDIGHQAYGHKLLTGRRSRLGTIRSLGGLAPFVDRRESRYDAFGGGHAGVAISAAAGFALAERLRGGRRRSIAVIGDGGLTAGMAFEALNHAGGAGLDLLVVLNDNDCSISPNVGALRDTAARALGRPLPPGADPAAAGGSLAGLFGALGFACAGPVDGHDLPALIAALEHQRAQNGPRLLQVVTVKGRGFAPAEADPVGWHGVPPFDPAQPALPATTAKGWSEYFGDWLCTAAEREPRLVAITPAMREGSGLVRYAERFPDRHVDVGIAEQHALTLAAGLACGGARPVVAIYSTFLQRAIDQLIHDIALQRLPVLLAIDRAGLVGPDGATHHGAFDLGLLRGLPNLVLLAPADGEDLVRMLDAALAHDGPVAVRWPRGTPPAAPAMAEPVASTLGTARWLRRRSAADAGGVALVSVGALWPAALAAADALDASLLDLRSIRPLDTVRLRAAAQTHALLVTIEDHQRDGGAGSAIADWLHDEALHVPLLRLGLQDRFMGHGSRDALLAEAGLDAAGIVAAVRARLAEPG